MAALWRSLSIEGSQYNFISCNISKYNYCNYIIFHCIIYLSNSLYGNIVIPNTYVGALGEWVGEWVGACVYVCE